MKKQSQNNSAFCILHSSFSSAFSLVEMIIVMLVIGILAVWGIEKVTTVLSSTRAQSAANELRVNLRYIRNMAMDRERTTRVIFTSNSYSVAISDTNGIFSPAANPVTQLPWEVYVDERFPGVELVGVSNIPNNTLDFSATNGIPLNTNGAWLTTTGSITFNSGLTVTIAPDTGYVELK